MVVDSIGLHVNINERRPGPVKLYWATIDIDGSLFNDDKWTVMPWGRDILYNCPVDGLMM